MCYGVKRKILRRGEDFLNKLLSLLLVILSIDCRGGIWKNLRIFEGNILWDSWIL